MAAISGTLCTRRKSGPVRNGNFNYKSYTFTGSRHAKDRSAHAVRRHHWPENEQIIKLIKANQSSLKYCNFHEQFLSNALEQFL